MTHYRIYMNYIVFTSMDSKNYNKNSDYAGIGTGLQRSKKWIGTQVPTLCFRYNLSSLKMKCTFFLL